MTHLSQLWHFFFVFISFFILTTGFTSFTIAKSLTVAVHNINKNCYAKYHFYSYYKCRGFCRQDSYLRLSSSITSENAINALLTEAIKIASKNIDQENSTGKDTGRQGKIKKLPFYLKFSSKHVESISLVDQEKAVAYLSLPATSYSVINTTLVTRQSDDTFRFTLPLQEITSMTPIQINANLVTDITVNPQPQDNRVVMRSGSILFEPLPSTSKSPFPPRSTSATVGAPFTSGSTASTSEAATSPVVSEGASDTTAYQEVDELGLPLWILWGEDKDSDEGNVKFNPETSFETENMQFPFGQTSRLNNNSNNSSNSPHTDANAKSSHPYQPVDGLLAGDPLLAIKGNLSSGTAEEDGHDYNAARIGDDVGSASSQTIPGTSLQAFKKSAIQAEVVIKLEWDDCDATATTSSSSLSRLINTSKRSFNGFKSIFGFLPKKDNDLMGPTVSSGKTVSTKVNSLEMIANNEDAISIDKENLPIKENSSDTRIVSIQESISTSELSYIDNRLQVRAIVEVNVEVCINLPARYTTALSFFPIRSLIERAAALTASSVLKAIGPGLTAGLQKDYHTRKDNGLLL